jgi:hypothetical protein
MSMDARLAGRAIKAGTASAVSRYFIRLERCLRSARLPADSRPVDAGPDAKKEGCRQLGFWRCQNTQKQP